MDKKKTLKTYKENSCSGCKQQDWPNKKVGRICCLKYPVKARDYYDNEVNLEKEEDLYEFYKRDSKAQADKWSKKQNRIVKPDSFYDWVLKRGICPYGIMSDSTRYWLELFSVYDSDMGLNVPMDYKELPNVFFEALRTYRENRPVEDLPKVPNAK